MKKNIVTVIGTRPEAIKCSPVIKALRAESWANPITLITAQHRDLLDSAFADLGLSADIDLDLMRSGQSLSEITGRAFIELEKAFNACRPDFVLAQGDTTTVMVVATVCFYLKIPFGHIEAGLRTGDMNNPFPEEFNRVVASHAAKLHFAPTSLSRTALLNEGIDSKQIFITGNTGIDTIIDVGNKVSVRPSQFDGGKRLILFTSHRRENFGQPMRNAFDGIIKILEEYNDVELLFPVHPNPNVRSVVNEMLVGNPKVHLCDPLDYSDFVSAMKASYFIVTDSGGVQEEAPILGKPVLVMRSETERPEALHAGVSKLIGTASDSVYSNCKMLLESVDSYKKMATGSSPYGDGIASIRIARILADYFEEKSVYPEFSQFVG